MKRIAIALAAASILLPPASAAAPDPSVDGAAGRKLICKPAGRPLGSRIKKAGACRPAGEVEPERDQPLPIGLQFKPAQPEPGQRRPQ